MIYATELIFARSKRDFDRRLNAAIDTWQDQGLHVDVQFQPVGDWWAALLIARKPQ